VEREKQRANSCWIIFAFRVLREKPHPAFSLARGGLKKKRRWKFFRAFFDNFFGLI